MPSKVNSEFPASEKGRTFSISLSSSSSSTLTLPDLPRRSALTNREIYGTWKHGFDFNLTMIGYVIGIHNFFRFPQMCYKWGLLTFLLPYIIILILLGIPAVFMEATIGQYYGVGTSTAFRHMSPFLAGLSKVLAWNSFLNSWCYGLILIWVRSYSGDSLSCLKGWIGCSSEHYFNTPFCYTSTLDDCCAGLSNRDDVELCPEFTSMRDTNEDRSSLIFYNFRCVQTADFCAWQGWTYTGKKLCVDEKANKTHSIYERRIHATSEYLYGFVLGMQKKFTILALKKEMEACEKELGPGHENCTVHGVRREGDWRRQVYETHEAGELWADVGRHMTVDSESSSFIALPTQALTMVLFITFFLFIDLLSVSAVTYVMSSVPFAVLIWILYESLKFRGSTEGLDDAFSSRGFSSIWTSADLWTDAVIQVILTSGIGNGAILSLATFNKWRHSYLYDIMFVTIINLATSICATLVTFCTIGHYIKEYSVSLPFEAFLMPESRFSSVDFGFLATSFFLIKEDKKDLTIFMYFFMLSSIVTDTTIRLAQNMLDTAAQLLPRLRYHSIMALVATSFFFLLTLLPITTNGGFLLFLEFEFYAQRFAMPIVVLLEIGGVAWFYGTERLLQNAAEMGTDVGRTMVGRIVFLLSLKIISPLILLSVILYSLFGLLLGQRKERIAGSALNSTAELEILSSWLFCLAPLVVFGLTLLNEKLAKRRLVAYQKEWAHQHHQHHHDSGQGQEGRGKEEEEKPQPSEKEEEDLPTPVPLLGRRRSVAPGPLKAAHHRRQSMAAPPTPASLQEDELKQMIMEAKIENLKKDRDREDGHGRMAEEEMEEEVRPGSVNSSELSDWKSYIFWNELLAHLEDWPDRLDESEVESEATSSDSD